jgi:hypothetical protein
MIKIVECRSLLSYARNLILKIIFARLKLEQLAQRYSDGTEETRQIRGQ